MSAVMAARGPDDAGTWVDPQQGLALGFRRLAVIDVSPGGHQPMVSADGRYVIAYNGEVYNFAELRRDLAVPGVRLRGGSDTEAILEAISQWGIAATLPRLNGMFAFALWDRSEARLHLVRDRLGIKPLYWTRQGDLVWFGSELKALRAYPRLDASVDREAMAAYLRLGYVPAPHTIYRGVHKLEPGQHLTIGAAGGERIESYWSAADVVRAGASGRRRDAPIDRKRATDQLEGALKAAVGRQMTADVPLGAFLSGGIDSSTVVALMQANSARPVRTFTIGFREAGYDEAAQASAVARHLGTEHTEVYVEPQDARSVIPRLADIYDEPFADSSQIPTLLLAETTRRCVTVALSGDGGDELFAGYERYRAAEQTWRWLRLVPAPVRVLLGIGCRAAALPGFAQVLDALPPLSGMALTSGRLLKLADSLGMGGGDLLYRQIVSQWGRPGTLLPGVREAPHALIGNGAPALVPDFGERMRYLDLQTYLPDDILTKVDRASMAVSLEVRVPLLDHTVVEHAWALPRHLLTHEGQSKWLLRQVLYRYVPPALVDRPKMGFGVPIGTWLRGPLRDWAETLLSEKALRANGIEPKLVRRRWALHVAGTQNWEYPLWTVLMLQAWSQRWNNTA